MQELETLLNTLIQRGWKPWGKKYTHFNYDPQRKHRHIMFGGVDLAVFSYSLRQLVSLESGLWQFCTAKGLVQKGLGFWQKGKKTAGVKPEIMQHQPEYRLLESALVPEEKLAQFLIENIKTE